MNRIIPLNEVQISLVEENIAVINTVIFKRIIYNNNTYGLEYDDLYQEGCLLLCKAAMKYDEDKNCSFKSFAYVVVLNGLISYCRKINKKNKDESLYVQTQKEMSCTNLISHKDLQEQIDECDIICFLENIKKQYSGTTRLGIEALEWKVKGFSGSEIAKIYNVTPNNVGAWISRALKKLKKNSVFNLYMGEFFKEKSL